LCVDCGCGAEGKGRRVWEGVFWWWEGEEY
jgi:hypothetical protein